MAKLTRRMVNLGLLLASAATLAGWRRGGRTGTVLTDNSGNILTDNNGNPLTVA